MRQGNPGAMYLAHAATTTQLVDQLGALCEAGGTERVPLAQQAAAEGLVTTLPP